MTVSVPRPRRMPRAAGTIVILVIILAFIAVMAALGCSPAVALGVAAGAVTLSFNPGSARAVLGILAPGPQAVAADAAS
jgi:hypothetical protein